MGIAHGIYCARGPPIGIHSDRRIIANSWKRGPREQMNAGQVPRNGEISAT
jgi:hypothetical protein